MGLRRNLESMLAAGQDNALLRFTLGNECFKEGDGALATEHYRAATEQDPRYTAAWKQLGKALEMQGDLEGALAAWEKGRKVAEEKGDVQAGKEMMVFSRRLEKRRTQDSGGGG